MIFWQISRQKLSTNFFNALQDYNELFEGTMDTDEDLDALLLGEEEGVDRRPSMPERQPLSHFGPRQGKIQDSKHITKLISVV